MSVGLNILLELICTDSPISLHLSQSQSSVPRSSLGRLPRQHRPRSSRPRVHLVHDHVLELLVVDRTKEDVRLERLTGDSRGEHVLPGVPEAGLDQDLLHVLDFGATEGGSVLEAKKRFRKAAAGQ
jgi:hypothetical protein